METCKLKQEPSVCVSFVIDRRGAASRSRLCEMKVQGLVFYASMDSSGKWIGNAMDFLLFVRFMAEVYYIRYIAYIMEL